MAEETSVRREGSLAIITIDNPPVNALSAPVRAQLLGAIETLSGDASIEAVLIRCAGRTFVAGADIREFDTGVSEPAARRVFTAIERFARPVVAALHGTALCAGLELALACHYRCAAPGARLGLPEPTLGIIPGAGGTQRLPRLVGARRALELILEAAPIGAEQARRIGLIDRLIPGDLAAGAEAFARELIAQRAPARPTCAMTVDASGFDEQFVEQCLAASRARMRGQQAPQLAAEAVRAATQMSCEQGLEREAQIARRQLHSEEARALRHLFFAERAAARVPGLPDSTRPLTLQRIGIIGAGTRGAEIAVSCADAGLTVELIDASADALSQALAAIRRIYDGAVAGGRISAGRMAERLALIHGGLDLAAANDVDLAIETVAEDMRLKKELFGRLGSMRCADALLASSTSRLDLDEIAAASGRPGSVVGLHFIGPAHLVRPLEIARGRSTSPEALATALALAKRLRKPGVVVGVGPGLVGDRMHDRYRLEAERLLGEGATPRQLDRVLEAFGFAKGPYGEAVEELAPRPGIERRTVNDEEIEARCVYSLVNEGAKILAEGIAYRSGDIDVICTTGYGFPRFRGGPMFHADRIGLANVDEQIGRLHAQLGQSWQPAPLLKELARSGRTFTKWSSERH